MQPGRVSRLAYLLALLSGFFAEQVFAAKDWDANAGLTTQAIFSDNVHLEKSNKQSDLGVRVTPSIGLQKDTRYNKLSFQYGLSYLEHLSIPVQGDYQHNLTANWNSELYRDTLFLDLRANAGQTLTSRTGANRGDDFTSGNTIQTFVYSISPYTRHHFGTIADLEVRYTNDGVFLDSDSASNSSSNRVNFSLNSGRGFKAVAWDVIGSYRLVEQEDSGDDDSYADARASVSYALNRYWAPNLFVAYEDNEIETSSKKPSEVIYGAGITWTPNRSLAVNLSINSESNIGGGVIWTPSKRTELELSYGDDPFNESFLFKLKHRSRRSVISASYSENHTTTSRDELLERQTFELVDSFGNTIVDPITGQPILVEQDSPDLNDETYVLSRFELGYDVNIGRRDSLSFSAHHTNRDYQVSRRSETNWGINAHWSHILAANLRSNLRIAWDTFDGDTDADDSIDWSLGSALTYNLTSKTSLTLDLQHRVNDASTAASGYTENRVTMTLGTSW